MVRIIAFVWWVKGERKRKTGLVTTLLEVDVFLGGILCGMDPRFLSGCLSVCALSGQWLKEWVSGMNHTESIQLGLPATITWDAQATWLFPYAFIEVFTSIGFYPTRLSTWRLNAAGVFLMSPFDTNAWVSNGWCLFSNLNVATPIPLSLYI